MTKFKTDDRVRVNDTIPGMWFFKPGDVGTITHVSDPDMGITVEFDNYEGHQGFVSASMIELVTKPDTKPATVLGTQIGGDHYTKQAIQPIEYIWANKLGFSEGNIVKYVTRWKDKGGIKDLEKAAHHCNLLIEEARRNEAKGDKFGL